MHRYCTRVCLWYAPPLVIRFRRPPETTRTMFGLAAGLTTRAAHIPCAPTLATEVVVTVGWPPPERRTFSSEWAHDHRFPVIHWLVNLPSINKRACSVLCVGIVGRHGAQVTGNVKLQYKRLSSKRCFCDQVIWQTFSPLHCRHRGT